MNSHHAHTFLSVERGLSLSGTCGYEIQGDQISINIAKIANSREYSNVSGTLAIELWALSHPYTGGGFSGTMLARTEVGQIYGQHFLADCHYRLNFQEPSEGLWFFVLMLREWAESGYVTRDYLNFAVPYQAGTTADIEGATTSTDIHASFTENDKSSEKPSFNGASGTADARPNPTKVDAQATVVSLNEASLKEIAEVKGVSKKLAENIVAARPFESLEAVLQVKGMGAKLLEKIRRFIAL